MCDSGSRFHCSDDRFFMLSLERLFNHQELPYGDYQRPDTQAVRQGYTRRRADKRESFSKLQIWSFLFFIRLHGERERDRQTDRQTETERDRDRERWTDSQIHRFLFNNCIVLLGFLPWEIRIAFTEESQLRQSCTTQPTAHVGCFSLSIIHQTLTWTTESLMCVTESALKVDSGRKIPCRTWESNLPQRRAGLWLSSWRDGYLSSTITRWVDRLVDSHRRIEN